MIKRILLFLLISLSFLYLVLKLFSPSLSKSKFQLEKFGFRVAHRCGKNVFPENTLFACKKLVEENLADVLEMDVHLTKDNKLVVIHDSTLDRTTNRNGKIKDWDYEEILKLDAGYKFLDSEGNYSYRGKGIQILELEEFFKELPNSNYFIEVKVKEKLASEILVKLIEDYSMQKKVIIGSLYDEVNTYLIELSKGEIPIFIGVKNFAKWYFLYLIGLREYFSVENYTFALPGNFFLLQINQSFLQACKEQNIRVDVFTINKIEKMEEYKKLKIDGIMTDEIRLINKIP